MPKADITLLRGDRPPFDALDQLEQWAGKTAQRRGEGRRVIAAFKEYGNRLRVHAVAHDYESCGACDITLTYEVKGRQKDHFAAMKFLANAAA